MRQDFNWATVHQLSKPLGEFNTDLGTINTKRIMQLLKEFYSHERNTYHSRGDFFWAKQENESPEEHWRKLVSQETIMNLNTSKKKFFSKKSMTNTKKLKPKKSNKYLDFMLNPETLMKETAAGPDFIDRKPQHQSDTHRIQDSGEETFPIDRVS